MKQGFKLFGFLLGVVSGGLFTLFTANRKGSELRKDISKALKNKESLSAVLLEEIKGLGEEARKVAQEMTQSDIALEYKEMAKDKFDELYTKAKDKMQETMVTFESEWDMLRKEVDTKGKEFMDKLPKKASAKKDE